LAGILAGDELNFFQRLDGPMGNVPQIPNRRPHEIQRSRFRQGIAP
jgi:hypothetical protein